MTEKRALENSIEMWEEFKKLSKKQQIVNILRLKELYFDIIVTNNPKYNIPVSYCYLCEYAKDTGCIKCPVKNWSKERKYGGIAKYCVGKNSVYNLFKPNETIENVLELLKETYNDLYNN